MAMSAAYLALQLVRIPVALDFYRRQRAVDITQIVRCQLHIQRSDVLLQPLQLRGAGNGYDPRLLRQQPCQCDLCLRDSLGLAELSDHFDQALVRFTGLR